MCVCAPHQFWMAETIFKKLGMYIMAPSFISPSHQSVCVHKCIPFLLLVNVSVKIPVSLLGNGLAKRYRVNKYTSNDRRIVRRVVFYAVLCHIEETRLLALPRISCKIIISFLSSGLRVSTRIIRSCAALSTAVLQDQSLGYTCFCYWRHQQKYWSLHGSFWEISSLLGTTQSIAVAPVLDDIFVAWPHGPERLQNFLSHLNNLIPSIQLTMET
jgi:hypothetical protein